MSDDDELIFAAARQRDDALERLLAKGADPNVRDAAGRTPLHHAARIDPENVQRLLLAGADANARDAGGCAPLHFAASVGTDSLRRLIAARAEVDAADANGHTPLDHALHGGWIEAASALLEAGADPRHADDTGETGLDRLSARHGTGLIDETWRADMILHGPDRVGEHLRRLIDQDLVGRLQMVLAPRLRTGYYSASADVELPRDTWAMGSWQRLARELRAHCESRGAWPQLLALHQCGLPVELPPALADGEASPRRAVALSAGEGPYALIAAALGSGAALRFVLAHAPESAVAAGAALFALLPFGTWPTNEQLEAERRAAFARLVDAGIDLDAPIATALEALHRAMALPRDAGGNLAWDDARGLAARFSSVIDFLQMLSNDRTNPTPLLEAAKLGSTLIPALVAAGANPRLVSANGRNGLHFACMRGDRAMRPVEPVVELLDAGIPVDARDANGWRPLALAIHPGVIRELLRRGAAPELDEIDRGLLGTGVVARAAAIRAAQ